MTTTSPPDCRHYEANTPHNPVRFADTIGLVLERVRPEGSTGALVCYPVFDAEDVTTAPTDRLRWYCKQPTHSKPTIIREEKLHVTDLGTQLKPIIQNWMAHEDLRKCSECGAVAEAK